MAKKHQEESWKNLDDYRKGKAQLQNAVLQHPEEDPKTSIFDYVKKNVNRKLWVIPYSQFKRKGGK
jgi:hypothetical protein